MTNTQKGTTTTMNTRSLATTLINLAADYDDAGRPIDTKTTKATLSGACKAAYAVGFRGVTPDGLFLEALDYVRTNRRPTTGAAFPTAYRTWVDNGTNTLAAFLDNNYRT